MRALLVCVLAAGCSSVAVTEVDSGEAVDAGVVTVGADGSQADPDAGMPTEDGGDVTPDSGTNEDAGRDEDAGHDAGTVETMDAGRDAGVPPIDAGYDAGHDAGPVVDTTAPVQLALGDEHSCLLRTSGEVHCWGYPSDLDPRDVGAVSIAADGTSTCGTTSTGEVLCWTSFDPAPIAIPAMDVTTTACGIGTSSLVSCWSGVVGAPAGTVRAIDSYAQQHCAVGTDGTTVSCWNGAMTAPAPWVAGITSVAIGQSHACVLAGAGGVWCWGNNGRGQVGSWDYRAGLSPTMAGGAVGYAEVVAGRWHTCGRRDDGSVWCWGDNASRQLGRVLRDGLTRDHMAGEVLLGGARMNALDIDAGRNHTCAILVDSRIVCWGSNSSGQLGTWVDGLMSAEPVEPDAFWTE